LVGVDKAQAAVLNYTFHEKTYGYNGFFTVDNSSLTGIGVEEVYVSEGRFNGFPLAPFLLDENYYYNDLTERARAVFYQGEFRGLEAVDWNQGWRAKHYLPGEFSWAPQGYSWYATESAYWEITTRGPDHPSMWTSRISGYSEYREEITGRIPEYPFWTEIYESRQEINDAEVYYTLVPEPLTAGGTALALAGLSWLKHKKKRAA
jgi:hypothetical protein